MVIVGGDADVTRCSTTRTCSPRDRGRARSVRSGRSSPSDRSARAPQLPQAPRPALRPRRIALLEDRTRDLVQDLVAAVARPGGCNFHHSIAEPLPTTVFLQLLGLPVAAPRSSSRSRTASSARRLHPSERVAMVNETGQKIYAVLQEVVDQRSSRA